VSELAKPHAMSMPSLLQHLDVLEECRLVRTEKSGRVRTCQMRASGLGAAGDWIAAQRAIWKGRLDRMETYVASLKRKEKKHAKGPEPK
jgi:DNA-binding transcriptional ArsR family regulator